MKWNARVIYGDTDSIFVLLKGQSKEDAFKIGNEIADIVTKDNPIPVKLKFEKVYLPCILQVSFFKYIFMTNMIIQHFIIFNILKFRQKRDIVVICMKILNKKNLNMKLKVLKLCVVMVVQLYQKYVF